MKPAFAILVMLFLFGCEGSRTDQQTGSATHEANKTMAEKAYDAGQRARKKAESIKEEQNKKAQETDDVANQ